MKQETLKSCPFCGGEVEIQETSGAFSVGSFNVRCVCYVTSAFFKTEQETIKAWNTRKGETK